MTAAFIERLRTTPEAPAALLTPILARARTATKSAGKIANGVTLDTPDQIRRATAKARALLRQHGPASNRYVCANEIKDAGVGEAECLRVMREAGFDEAGQTSLEQKVASAYRNGQNPAGADVVELRNFVEQVKAKAISSRDPGLYPTSLTRARDAAGTPRKPYLIEGYVREREVNLAPGDGNVGKGRLWMQAAVAVAAGKSDVVGLSIRRRMPAVFVSAEDDDGELYRRAHGIALEMGLPDIPEDLYLLSLVDCEGPMTLAQAVADSSVAPGPFLDPLLNLLKPLGDHLLILDAASDAADIDEQSKGQANVFLKRYVRQLCVKARSTAVLIAHPTKSAAKDRTFVSSPGWRNGVRSMICGERVKLTKTGWKEDPGSRGPDYYARFWQDKGNDLERTVPELILRSSTGRVGFILVGTPVDLPDAEGGNVLDIWSGVIAGHMLDTHLTFIGLDKAAEHLAKLAAQTPQDQRAALGYAGEKGGPRSQTSFRQRLDGTRGAGFREATVCDGGYVLRLATSTKGGRKHRGLELVDQTGAFT